jgi:hypothetical protein
LAHLEPVFARVGAHRPLFAFCLCAPTQTLCYFAFVAGYRLAVLAFRENDVPGLKSTSPRKPSLNLARGLGLHLDWSSLRRCGMVASSGAPGGMSNGNSGSDRRQGGPVGSHYIEIEVGEFALSVAEECDPVAIGGIGRVDVVVRKWRPGQSAHRISSPFVDAAPEPIGVGSKGEAPT